MLSGEKKRILIAAPGSGSGKTLMTCALLKALKNRGKDVRAFKCGPDYIDPMFHRTVIGIPSENLDLFFTGEDGTREIFERYAGEISVIEGVMGLYDGMGVTSESASSYHLAKVLRAPVILVVNAKGMGRSVLAVIRGFLSMDTEHLIRGVILNRIPETLCRSLKPMIEAETGIEVLGFFPQNERLQFESRHLGLQMPEEIRHLESILAEAADTLEKTVNINEILSIADNSDRGSYRDCKPASVETGLLEERFRNRIAEVGEANVKQEKSDTKISKAQKADTNSPYAEDGTEEQNAAFSDPKRVRIGIARDRAFCFYYNENIRILKSLGAEPVYFSLLSDETLPPDLDGLLLGGGYPELFAAQLSANTSMCTSIRQAVQMGLPTAAECGGFMYLHERLVTKDGASYPMAGVIKGEVTEQSRLVRFGYISLSENSAGPEKTTEPGKAAEPEKAAGVEKLTGTEPACWIPEGSSIRGHEFHYYDSTDNGKDCRAVKPVTGRNWPCVHVTPTVFFGFPHLYYASCPAFAENFVKKCRYYAKSEMRGPAK